MTAMVLPLAGAIERCFIIFAKKVSAQYILEGAQTAKYFYQRAYWQAACARKASGYY